MGDVDGFLVPHARPMSLQDEEPEWRLDRPEHKPSKREPPNQFLVLIYNLLLADIQQAVAFLLNATWLARDAVAVGTDACWAQGWFVSTGDLASSVFIGAIAIHTYLDLVRGYRPSTWAFYSAIIVLWGFVYGMALLGIAITSNGAANGGLYVRAGAWVSTTSIRLILSESDRGRAVLDQCRVPTSSSLSTLSLDFYMPGHDFGNLCHHLLSHMFSL